MADWKRKLNDPKYARTFLLLALLFILGGSYLKWMASEKENLAQALERDNKMVAAFSARPAAPSSRPFLESLFPAVSSSVLLAALEASGVQVDSITEEQKEEEKGIFHIFHVSGTGSYAQIVQTFDIIKGKERWSAVNLKELKRSPKGLAYELEIRTFQIRGTTYEEEKYSPHRPNGHRKEPGSQNPL